MTDSSQSSLLAAVWPIVRRRRWVIFGCGMAAAMAAALFTGGATPEYQAATSIRVDERAQNLPLQDVLRLSPGGGRNTAANNVSTEMQMLQTRSLARTVVDSLGLRMQLRAPLNVPRGSVFAEVAVSAEAEPGAYAVEWTPGRAAVLHDRAGDRSLGHLDAEGRIDLPGVSLRLAPTATGFARIEFDILSSDAAVRELSGAIEVTRRSRDTEIIELRYRGSDPELVRDVTNALAVQFIAERNRNNSRSTESTIDFIRTQISGIEARLVEAEEALRTYREAAGVVSVQDQATTEVRQAADLLAQRNVIEAERAALARLLNDAERRGSRAGGAAPSSYRDLVAFPSLLRNPAVTSLLGSLNQVEDRRADLLSRRSPDDQDLMILTNRAGELEQHLRTLAAGYLQGLSSQVTALDGVLASTNHELGKIPEREMRFAQLQREVRGLEQVYDQLQARMKEAEIAGAAQDASIRLVDAAMLPTRPIPSRRKLVLVLSLVAGLVGGTGLAFLRELKDGSVRTRGDAQFAVGLPVLGMIPRMADSQPRFPRSARRLLQASSRSVASEGSTAVVAGQSAAVFPAAGRAYVADAYERLHTNLLYARPDEELRVVVFTSPLPGDGKSTSAANFALALAKRGLRVALVDADLRRGTLNKVFGVPRTPGLVDLLSGQVEWNEALRSVYRAGSGQLDLLATGELPANPTQVLDSPATRALLESLCTRYDRVILDTPPLNIVSDAVLFNAVADAVVMVARAAVTPVDALVYATEIARTAQMPLIGTLLNDIDFEKDASYDPAYKWYSYGKAYYDEVAS